MYVRPSFSGGPDGRVRSVCREPVRWAKMGPRKSVVMAKICELKHGSQGLPRSLYDGGEVGVHIAGL